MKHQMAWIVGLISLLVIGTSALMLTTTAQTVTVPKTNHGVLVGDVNGDGAVNSLDRTLLTRYLSKWTGYEAKINSYGADINGDGEPNLPDRMILSRYISNWQGYGDYFFETVTSSEVSSQTSSQTSSETTSKIIVADPSDEGFGPIYH